MRTYCYKLLRSYLRGKQRRHHIVNRSERKGGGKTKEMARVNENFIMALSPRLTAPTTTDRPRPALTGAQLIASKLPQYLAAYHVESKPSVGRPFDSWARCCRQWSHRKPLASCRADALHSDARHCRWGVAEGQRGCATNPLPQRGPVPSGLVLYRDTSECPT